MDKNKVFVFIGAPGSGKGSISSLCVEKFKWKQLSTGELCRKHIKEQTEIGKQIDFSIKSGKLVSDSIIIEMVNEWLGEQLDLGETIILDGYPRTFAQAEALDAFLKERFSKSDLKVVRFILPDEVAIDRLCERYVCKNIDCQAIFSMASGSGLKPKIEMVCDICSSPLKRRSDDTRESVAERLKIFHEHEKKLLDFYNQKEVSIYELNVQNPLGVVFENFKELIGLED